MDYLQAAHAHIVFMQSVAVRQFKLSCHVYRSSTYFFKKSKSDRSAPWKAINKWGELTEFTTNVAWSKATHSMPHHILLVDNSHKHTETHGTQQHCNGSTGKPNKYWCGTWRWLQATSGKHGAPLVSFVVQILKHSHTHAQYVIVTEATVQIVNYACWCRMLDARQQTGS